jgi:hypothetical protein
MNLRIVSTVACFALLHPVCFTQDAPAKITPAQDIQKHAEALIEHARQLSDIRGANAPAFQLKATFSFTGADLEPVHGTYTEVWMSKSQWRREIASKYWRRIEIAGTTSIWRLDNVDDFPETASQLPSLLDPFPLQSQSLVFEAVLDHPDSNPPVECAIIKPDTSHRKSAFCFDEKSGVLLEKIFPQVRLRNVAEDSCDYGSFRKVGGFWFAREMICFEDRHKKIAANLVDLSPAPMPDPAFFTPPPGAIELGICPVTPVPPQVEFSPLTTFRLGMPGVTPGAIDPDSISWITVWFVVDIKGKPQYARIVRSAPRNKAAQKRILDKLRDLGLKPGTCNGVPTPMALSVQLPD